MSSPFEKPTPSELLNDMLEHFVSGIVTLHGEDHKNDSTNPIFIDDAPPYNYRLQCGYPELTTSQTKLVAIERIHGMKNDSFRNFIFTEDYTYDLATKTLIFITGKEPDEDTVFTIKYKYDQGYTSGVTNISRGTATEMIFSAVAFRLGESFNNLELAKAAAFIDTAVGDDLRKLVKILGIEGKDATKSSGYLTVYHEGSGDVVIPVGGAFSTYATDIQRAIIFEIIEAGLFVKGFNSARVLVQAKVGFEGKESNIAPNRITRVVDATGASITACINPSNYTDYEFVDALIGKYIYLLSNLPERVINSQAFPPALNDNGFYAICYWIDKDINVTVGNWTLDLGTGGGVTVTEGQPQTGETKINVTDLGSGNKPFIKIDTLTIPKQVIDPNIAGYDHIFILARGDIGGEQISIWIKDNKGREYNLPLVKFGESIGGAAVVKTLSKDYEVYMALQELDITDLTGIDGSTYTTPTDNFISPTGNFVNDVTIGDTLIISDGTVKGVYTIDDVVNATTLTISPEPTDDPGSLDWEVDTKIKELRIEFHSVTGAINAIYFDWIASGTFLQEVNASSLNTPDEISISYTSGRLSVYNSTTTGDFFDAYDGDIISDNHVDQFLFYYNWKNNIAGGTNIETDLELRERAKAHASSLGKGTKRALIKAILDIDGIKQVDVQDYDDDPSILPGDVNITVLSEGFVISQSLQNEVIAVINENRPAGVRTNLYLPEVRYVNFTIELVYDDTDQRYVGTNGELTLNRICDSVIDDYFADKVKVVVSKHVFYSNLISYIIKLIDVVLSGEIIYDGSTEPTFVDDNFSGTYVFDSAVIFDTYFSSAKINVSMVVQRGNAVIINLIKSSSL